MIPDGTVRIIVDSDGLPRRCVYRGGAWHSRPGDDRERLLSGNDGSDLEGLSIRQQSQRLTGEIITRLYGSDGIRPIFYQTGPYNGSLSHVAMREQARAVGLDWCAHCWVGGIRGHLTRPGQQTPGNRVCRAAQAEMNARRRARQINHAD